MAQWQRPLAGRLPPRVRTLGAAQNFRCLPWGISFKKKGEQNDQKKNSRTRRRAVYLCIKKKKWSDYKTPSTTLDQNGAGETVLKQGTITSKSN